MKTDDPQWLKLLRFMAHGNTIDVRKAANLFGIYCLHKRITDIYTHTGIVCDRDIKPTQKSYVAVHFIQNPESWKTQLQKQGIQVGELAI